MAPSYRPSLCRAAVFAAVAAVLVLTGCGRRGPLEPPSVAAATAAKPAQFAAPAPPPPNRPFVLDRLL